MIQKCLGIGLVILVLLGVQLRLSELNAQCFLLNGCASPVFSLATIDVPPIITRSFFSTDPYFLGHGPVPLSPGTVGLFQLDGADPDPNSELDGESSEELFLDVTPRRSRQSIKFDPPAIAIQVQSNAGDMTLRCGDQWQTYACSPGKTLTIHHNDDQPIPEFWVQNESDRHVRMRIQILEQVPADAPMP